MTDSVADPVAELLNAVRRRIRLAWMLAVVERWGPLTAGIGLSLVLLARLLPWTWIEPAALFVGGGAALALIVVGVTLPVGVEAAARSADRGLATGDALSTSVQFVDMPGVFGEAIRAQASAAARRGDARTAIPFTVDWRPFTAAAAVALTALCIVVLTDPAEHAPGRRDVERDALASEAAGLRAHADELARDPFTSPEQDTLASFVEQLAAQLDRAADLGTGLAALEQARSELEASVTDRFLAEKSAVQGLMRSLETRPLVEGRTDAVAQLEALGESLDELSAQDREALTERLAALAATQTVGNPAAADALGEAAAALSSGDFNLATAALATAASAQLNSEASLSDQMARAAAADLLSDAAIRLKGVDADSSGQISDQTRPGHEQQEQQGQQGAGSSVMTSASMAASEQQEQQGQGAGQQDAGRQGQGQGTEQTQDQGSGAGSGAPSGSVAGASGGTGQGQAGPGTANGRGDSTDTGDVGVPTLWSPNGVGDRRYVQGTPTSGESETVGHGSLISGDSGARVPVDEVLGDYLAEAVESLDRGRIPPSSRALVQRYFDTVAGF